MSALDRFADLPRWVAWCVEERNGKRTKIPYSPQEGRARTDDPSTWGTREAAEWRAKHLGNGVDGGIGILLGDLGDGAHLAGIDLDTCIGDDGALAPWAAAILAALPTYAERSPSGRGVKMFFLVGSGDVRSFLDKIEVESGSWGCRRTVPGENGKDHGPAVELYVAGRYFTVTGKRWEGAPDALAQLDAAQLERLAELIPRKRENGSSTDGRDNSRSGVAFRMGVEMRGAGKNFGEFCEAVRTHPVTAGWHDEKGTLYDGRELHRIWDKAAGGEEGAALGDDELGVWDAAEVMEGTIPPRGWLLGVSVCRKNVSSVLGTGSVGKSALRIAQALAMASGRPITGEYVHRRARALVISLEDDKDELKRRVKAAMLHHKITAEEIKGYLFLATPRGLKLATMDSAGRLQVGPLRSRLEGVIRRLRLDAVIIDPFVKAHGVPENDNNAIDQVVDMLAQLAIAENIAVDVPHHTRKGATGPGDAESGRGAGAFKDAGRLVYSLVHMTADEAEKLRLSEEEQRHLVRLDSAKVNIAPPSDKAAWFKLVGVKLGNVTAEYPNGDEVQTVEPWQPPAAIAVLARIGPAAVSAILNRIEAKLPNGQRFTAASQAKEERAAWRAVKEVVPSLREQECHQVIDSLLKTGALEMRPYRDPVQRSERQGLFVNADRRPGNVEPGV
jgi:hypothetical protein